MADLSNYALLDELRDRLTALQAKADKVPALEQDLRSAEAEADGLRGELIAMRERAEEAEDRLEIMDGDMERLYRAIAMREPHADLLRMLHDAFGDQCGLRQPSAEARLADLLTRPPASAAHG